MSTPLWVIFQIWVPSAAEEMGVTSRLLGMPGGVQKFGCRVHVGVEDDVLQERCGAGRFQADVGGHASPLIKVGRVHLIVDALRLQGGSPSCRAREGVELEDRRRPAP